MALRDIVDIGRCADDVVHQTRVGVDTDMRLHTKVPLLFLVELGAAINVALTTVPVLSIKPLAIKVALIVGSN